MNKCIAFTLLALACAEARKHHHQDPFAELDHQLSHSLAFHYLWPWSQLVQAAAAMDAEQNQEPQITVDAEHFEIKMNVKRFKPEELRIKVKNQYIIVEGRHRATSDDNRFMSNHFVQRFNLPPGSKQEEVTAVLNENGVLIVSAPRHEVPPPPPERIVPIEVRLPEPTTEKPTEETTPEKIETTSEKVETTPDKVEPETDTTQKVEETEKVNTSEKATETPLAELQSFDKTHVGKIRKKELKNTTKHVKDNEVTKGVEGNGLDYALLEAEE